MILPSGVQLHIETDGRLRCRLDTDHARGWLTPAPGAQCVDAAAVFATEFATAIGKGFVAADAAVLAMMASHDPRALPLLSWDDEPGPYATSPETLSGSLLGSLLGSSPAPSRRLDLYAIVDSAERVRLVVAAGIRTVQLRIKTPERPDAGWHAMLRDEVVRSVAAANAVGAELFINDHWQAAADAGAYGVHLGQEDLLALGDSGRTRLRATGMALGISSHSLWELCRARALAPRYVACGPVWPTLTKAMPWRPQGLDNLAWWCGMAEAPVVAIGGILEAEKVFEAARCGADGVCIVRGLGERPQDVVPGLQAALDAGREQARQSPVATPVWPHPSLSPP